MTPLAKINHHLTDKVADQMSGKIKIKGKEAVKTALIQSASLLFAHRGIAGVSVREIAQHAQVNHGLVHRHFGSKEGLVKAVLEHLSQEVHAHLESATPSHPNLESDSTSTELSFAAVLMSLFQNTESLGLHWKVLSHALLEGMAPEQLQSDFPVFKKLIHSCKTHLVFDSFLDQIRHHKDASNTSELPSESNLEDLLATAQATLYFSTGLGLLIFKPYLQHAVESQNIKWNDLAPHLLSLLVQSPSSHRSKEDQDRKE